MVQKLVAVALVSMVTSAEGLQNCLGINLGMAAACAMVQAYARPQVRLYPSQVVCCKRIHECCFSSFLSCLHLLPIQPSVGSPNFGVRSFSIFSACLLMSLFAIILSVYCRPLSCVDNLWSTCFLAGVSLSLLPSFIVLLAACTPCSKAASVWCLMQVKSSMLALSQTPKIIR